MLWALDLLRYSMKSIFESIEEFNREVVGIDRDELNLLNKTESDWLIGALHEEIDEFIEADELVDKVDALMDLIYFAAGGLTRMGVTHKQAQDIFDIIHTANMKKAGGVKKGRSVEFELDAHKPEGWLPPEDQMKKILRS
jgi:predicted HAD superfamily Cof-like phosphohydrolase